MRSLSPRDFLIASAFSIALMSSPMAVAQTAVMLQPPNAVELTSLRVVVALSQERSTTWVSVQMYGAADDAYLVVPVRAGYRLDAASDAWLEALEAATNPRVVPTGIDDPALSCPKGSKPKPGDAEVVGSLQPKPSLGPDGAATVRTFSELVVWAQDAGLGLSAGELASLAALDLQGYRFASLHFDPLVGSTLLRTLRIAAPEPTAAVPLLVTDVGAADVPVTVWVVGEGRMVPRDLPSMRIDPGEVIWRLADGSPKTNYEEVRNGLLGDAWNELWIEEAAGHVLPFRSTSYSGGLGSVPAVASEYFKRAASYGDGAQEVTACEARVASLENSQAQVGHACAAGALLVVQGGEPCEEELEPGETPPSDLRCGSADDLALAFGGSIPGKIWLTRWVGEISAWETRPQEGAEFADSIPVGPVVSCDRYDHSGCFDQEGGAGGSGGWGAGGSTGSGGAGGGGGNGSLPAGGSHQGSDPSSPWPPEEDDYGYGYADDEPSVSAEFSCWGGTSTPGDDYDDDSCAGDSSYNDGEDDSCAGDSSYEGEDESCTGDSSSSEGEDACSGDTSSEADESCSGDTESASAADSCDSGGDSASGAGESCSNSGSSSSDCAVGRGGRCAKKNGTLPISALTYLTAALALWGRRSRRPLTEPGSDQAANPCTRRGLS